MIGIEGAGASFTIEAVAGEADGAFRVRLPELPEGGAYRIAVGGSTTRVLDDVVVGEVWLASGQSNMEWTVSQSAFAADETRTARQTRVRWLDVEQSTSQSPAATVKATWRVVNPENVGAMTAVGYAFAREVAERLGTHVGLIGASWGGTRIEAWTSVEALYPVMPELYAELSALEEAARDVERIRAEHVARVAQWERENLGADPGNKGRELGWHEAGFDDSGWALMDLPSFWQSHGLRFNGVVWFRRSLDLGAAQIGRDQVLELGAIDDFDQTYFNGELVGEHPKGTPGAFKIRRRYRIPGRLVRAGVNVVAVRVFDHAGQGGFGGPIEAMALHDDVDAASRRPLAGPWRYAVEHRIELVPNEVWRTFPGTPPLLAPECTPATLFGGMIAPLVPYGLRGILWYQGESNTVEYAKYRDRMIALIRDWRTRFGQGHLPFYFVQLAAYRESIEWAYLREAQAQAASEPRCGMVTAIDVGDPGDIHPGNKREVGRRLALLALRDTYGHDDVEAAGPRLSRVTVGAGSDRDDEVRVHFANARGLRVRDGGARVLGFEIAGEDAAFFDAEARLDGETVVARAPAVPRPVAVRYAFRDCPDVNLVNGADLPAEPFRTDGV